MQTRVDRNFQKQNNSYLWELGCKECGKPFSKNEVAVLVDEDTDFQGDGEAYAFHKGKCFEIGHNKVRNNQYPYENSKI